MRLRLLAILFLVFSCNKSDDNNKRSDKDSGSSPAPAVAEGEIAVAGTLQIADGDLDPSAVSNRQVAVKDGADNIITTTVTDQNGRFEIAVPSALAIETGPETSLTGGSALMLESVIEDDGKGKVLAVRKPLSIPANAVENGRADLGSLPFAEVSAIRGRVKFVDGTGTESEVVNAFGTEVFLAGVSFFAKTDFQGRFLLLYVPAGTYELTIQKGALTKTVSVTVTVNVTSDLGEISILSDTTPPVTSVSLDSTDFRHATCVTLSTDEASAKTFFTTDGSTPTATEPFLYDSSNKISCGNAECPICLENSSLTLKYFSVDPSGNAENLKSNFYYYNERWADPTDVAAPSTSIFVNGLPVEGGTVIVHGQAEISFQVNEGADILYSLEQGDVASSETAYSEKIRISQSTLVRFHAKDYSGNTEPERTLDVKVFRWKKLAGPLALSDLGPQPPAVQFDPVRNKLVLLANQYVSTNHSLHTYEWENGAWVLRDSATNFTDTSPMQVQSDKISGSLRLHFDSSINKLVAVWPTGQHIGAAIYSPDAAIDNDDWTSARLSNNHDQCSLEDMAASTGVSFNSLFYPQDGRIILVPSTSGNSPKLSFLSYNADGTLWNCSESSPVSANTPIQAGQTMDYEQATSAFVLANTDTTKKAFFYGGVTGLGKLYSVNLSDLSTPTPTFAANESERIPPYRGPAGIWDTDRDRLLLFGGRRGASGEFSSKVWEWNKVDWQSYAYETGPVPRIKASVTYRTITKSFILVGGIDEFGQVLSDTWEYTYQ